jgi:hypothetical protein
MKSVCTWVTSVLFDEDFDRNHCVIRCRLLRPSLGVLFQKAVVEVGLKNLAHCHISLHILAAIPMIISCSLILISGERDGNNKNFEKLCLMMLYYLRLLESWTLFIVLYSDNDRVFRKVVLRNVFWLQKYFPRSCFGSEISKLIYRLDI